MYYSEHFYHILQEPAFINSPAGGSSGFLSRLMYNDKTLFAPVLPLSNKNRNTSIIQSIKNLKNR